MTSRLRSRRRWRVCRLVILPLLVVASSASGALHLALRTSDPASGAQLARAPSELRLTFTEPVELPTARVTLRAPDGTAVPLSGVQHAGDDARVLVAALAAPLREPGSYTVDWRAVGRDGHPVTGSFEFAVEEGAEGLAAPESLSTAPPAAPAPAAEPPIADSFDSRSPLYVLVRWLGYLALVPLLGALVFHGAILPRLGRVPDLRAHLDRIADALRRWARFLAVAFTVALLLRVAAQLVAVHGSFGGVNAAAFGRILATTWGRAWLLQLAGALTIVAALSFPRGRGTWAFATFAAIPIVIGAGLAGHAAAAESMAPVLVGVHALHVAAAGGWIGSLFLLLVVAVPALGGADTSRGASVARLVHAFSPVALACAALLVASGAGVALWHLGSVAALTGSEYGQTLLWKLALLLPVLALGAYNWRRLRPRLHERTHPARDLWRSAGVELLFALLVLAATAVLVATPPPA